MQYYKTNTHKTQTNTNESRHSEMGPVRENPIQNCKNYSSKCAHDWGLEEVCPRKFLKFNLDI